MSKCRRIILLLLLTFTVSTWNHVRCQDSLSVRSEYYPVIDGIIKTKVEYDLNNSLLRFEVRNARFGLRGAINQLMGYRIAADFNNEGKVQMLDAYVRLKPLRNLDITLGQRKIPFSTDYIRNPIENMFANRSFLSKYINEGMRDIGLYADYKIDIKIPIELLVGAVNGTGGNNPQWISRPNLVSRIIIGNDEGFRIAGNLYAGEREFHDNLSMTGGEIRYSRGKLFIESEYIRRNWTDTLSLRRHDDGFYIHSCYNFPVERKFLHLITPVARWDFIGQDIFKNEIDAGRITLGVNFGFETRQFYSELRLNYENYLTGTLPVHTDKLTFELVGRF